MRIVIALGGNALLRRGEPMTTEVQRRNIADRGGGDRAAGRASTASWSCTATGRRWACCRCRPRRTQGAEPYPLDVLDAGTQGMIGYLIQQELRSLLPLEHQVATLLTMIVVDPEDPAFASPTKFVGPVYQGGRRRAGRREGLGVPAGRCRLAAGGALARAPARSWRSRRSPGCSSGAPWSSARAAAASPRCTRPPVPARWWASRRSSTRISRASCSPRTWARTCSSWRPTWTGSTSTGARRSSDGWTR